jgi:hypothetical protein
MHPAIVQLMNTHDPTQTRIKLRSSEPPSFKHLFQHHEFEAVIDRVDVWMDFCGYESTWPVTLLLNFKLDELDKQELDVDVVAPKELGITISLEDVLAAQGNLVAIVSMLRQKIQTAHRDSIIPLARQTDRIAFELSSMEYDPLVDVMLSPWDANTVVFSIPIVNEPDVHSRLNVEFHVKDNKVDVANRELESVPLINVNDCPRISPDTSLLEYVPDVQDWIQEQLDVRGSSKPKREAFITSLAHELANCTLEYDTADWKSFAFFFKVDTESRICHIILQDTFPASQPIVWMTDPNSGQSTEMTQRIQYEWKLPMEDVAETLIQQLVDIVSPPLGR